MAVERIARTQPQHQVQQNLSQARDSCVAGMVRAANGSDPQRTLRRRMMSANLTVNASTTCRRSRSRRPHHVEADRRIRRQQHLAQRLDLLAIEPAEHDQHVHIGGGAQAFSAALPKRTIDHRLAPRWRSAAATNSRSVRVTSSGRSPATSRSGEVMSDGRRDCCCPVLRSPHRRHVELPPRHSPDNTTDKAMVSP